MQSLSKWKRTSPIFESAGNKAELQPNVMKPCQDVSQQNRATQNCVGKHQSLPKNTVPLCTARLTLKYRFSAKIRTSPFTSVVPSTFILDIADSSTGKMFAKKFDKAKCHEILGVSKNASLDDILKAYLKAVVKNHPDQGGDLEKFEEITQAYEVLNEPWLRWKYDRFGIDRPISVQQDHVAPLEVSLEGLYNGITVKLPFTRYVICTECNGQGAASVKCSGCQGSGKKVVSIEDLDSPKCNECKGTGETINYQNPCQLCKGDQFSEVKKLVDIHVEKGMQGGQKITVPKETFGTRSIGAVFIVQQKEHPKFKRKGDDLFVDHTLPLTEALFGFEFELIHLDKRKLIIKSDPGEVIKPSQLKEIKDEGMPIYQKPLMKGKLYIHFTVKFPDSLKPDQIKAIESILPLGYFSSKAN